MTEEAIAWTRDYAKPFTVYLFTNRNVIVFDDQGQQISELQGKVNCYGLDTQAVMIIANNAQQFRISKFREWAFDITREEFLYLLGLGFFLDHHDA